jgi:hypothetical protein
MDAHRYLQNLVPYYLDLVGISTNVVDKVYRYIDAKDWEDLDTFTVLPQLRDELDG